MPLAGSWFNYRNALDKLKMAIYEKMLDAWNNREVDAYWACLHDEWEMTWHSTGKVTNKTFVTSEQIKAIMESSDMKEWLCI